MTILTDIAGYIISHISLKNVMYYAIAIAFERILDGALRSSRAGKILSLLKSFVIALIVILVLVVSYEFAVYDKEELLRNSRKAEEEALRASKEQSRLKAEAMLTENLPKAKNEDAQAQYNLGFYYQEYEHDKGQAFYWYKKSAENNFAKSQYILGCHYSGKFGSYNSGFGAALVPTDYEKAVYWHKRASENGYSESDYELYRMYSEGIGVKKNYRTAYMYLFKVKLSEGKSFHHQRELDSLSKKLTKSQIKTEQRNAQKKFNRTKRK